MAVQKARIDTPPILHFLEGTHLLVRFAPLETTLQETPSRMLVPSESASNLPDHNFYIAHAHSPRLPKPTVTHYCEPSPTPRHFTQSARSLLVEHAKRLSRSGFPLPRE